ncbi:MAG TPA: hypothetical protein VLJ58_08730 [Ramlibacter sp.]|nr:hypothetical protein [Ramlibacter sp.]
MKHYDPDRTPDPQEWLALDEQERIHLVEAHHRAARVELPNVTVHACFHAMVENQIAEGLESTTRAMTRLTREGLSRHDALHAIGSVTAELFYEMMKTKEKGAENTTAARFNAAVERLTAKEWKRRFGSPTDEAP